MYITAGVFSVVCCLIFGGAFWSRASQAHQSPWMWGLGALVVYEVIICVLFLIEYLIASPLGAPDYAQSGLAVVIWLLFTFYFATVTDSVMAKSLTVPASA